MALRPRVIVTNDDGIDSPGLSALASALAPSYDVVVAAPAEDMSGSGTGIGRFDPSGVELTPVDLDGVEAYTVAGPPGLAVMAAALGAFGQPPDLVVSGINAGMNTGHSIIHSGTVGAALTARTFRSRGIAISLAHSDPWHWETAAAVGLSASRWILERERAPYVLNINVPGVPLDRVIGIHWADLDDFGHFRVANADIPDRRLQFVVSSPSTGADPASDTSLCARDYVAVTPLSTIAPAPFPDLDPTTIWRAGGLATEMDGVGAAEREELDMECPHGPCTCRIGGVGEHCSEQCRTGTRRGGLCACPHPECLGNRLPEDLEPT
jgi:5'-nucleotidase